MGAAVVVTSRFHCLHSIVNCMCQTAHCMCTVCLTPAKRQQCNEGLCFGATMPQLQADRRLTFFPLYFLSNRLSSPCRPCRPAGLERGRGLPSPLLPLPGPPFSSGCSFSWERCSGTARIEHPMHAARLSQQREQQPPIATAQKAGLRSVHDRRQCQR